MSIPASPILVPCAIKLAVDIALWRAESSDFLGEKGSFAMRVFDADLESSIVSYPDVKPLSVFLAWVAVNWRYNLP